MSNPDFSSLPDHRTLLRRDAFQLHGWATVAQPFREAVGGSDQAPSVTDEDLVNADKKSLVTWHGEDDLGQFISSCRLNLIESATDKTRYPPNRPAIIRVLYHAPTSSPPTFEDIKKFKIDDLSAPEKREKNATVPYALITVVRLGRGGNDRDLVRRYTTGGLEILSPVEYTYSHSDWVLGEPGRDYVLFYAESSTIETRYVPKGSIQNRLAAREWVREAIERKKANDKKAAEDASKDKQAAVTDISCIIMRRWGRFQFRSVKL